MWLRLLLLLLPPLLLIITVAASLILMLVLLVVVAAVIAVIVVVVVGAATAAVALAAGTGLHLRSVCLALVIRQKRFCSGVLGASSTHDFRSAFNLFNFALLPSSVFKHMSPMCFVSAQMSLFSS